MTRYSALLCFRIIFTCLAIFFGLLFPAAGHQGAGAHSDEKAPPLRVSRIADGVWVHTTYGMLEFGPFPSNGLILKAGNEVVIVDGGWGEDNTRQLLQWIDDSLQLKPALCIVTHAHDDRSSGIALMRERGIKVMASAYTNRLLAADSLPLPDISIQDGDTSLKVGKLKIETWYPGHGHAPDNIVVWLPQKKILFGGCFVKSTESQSLGNIADANLAEWEKAIVRTQKRYAYARIVVPGHQQWSDTSSLSHTLDLLRRNE